MMCVSVNDVMRKMEETITFSILHDNPGNGTRATPKEAMVLLLLSHETSS